MLRARGAETGRVKTIGEALTETMALATPRREIEIPTASAAGGFLARPVHARIDVPSFDASLVDGYAVRVAEVGPGVALRVLGESRAGHGTPALGPGTTMRIFTGARVPEGADAVVMQERVTRAGELARFESAALAGAGIRRRASDVQADAPLLGAGAVIDAAAIGLLASQGITRVAVRSGPSVSIVTTGDEVVPAGAALPEGGLHDANGPMLAQLVVSAGGMPAPVRHARDDLGELMDTLVATFTSDVVITVGGVSVGDHDLVHEALARLGVERRLWKVRMKPGKPIAIGTKGTTVVVGLPGNPVSAWVGFEVFVRPMLRRMLGDPRPYRVVREVVLGAPLRASVDRTELARARLDDAGVAWPAVKQGSSALASAIDVDALLILPEREGELAAGERVPAMLLDGRGSAQPPFV